MSEMFPHITLLQYARLKVNMHLPDWLIVRVLITVAALNDRYANENGFLYHTTVMESIIFDLGLIICTKFKYI